MYIIVISIDIEININNNVTSKPFVFSICGAEMPNNN